MGGVRFSHLGSTSGGNILGKMAKNCMKITKSTFLGQNSGWGEDMGDKPICAFGLEKIGKNCSKFLYSKIYSPFQTIFRLHHESSTVKHFKFKKKFLTLFSERLN